MSVFRSSLQGSSYSWITPEKRQDYYRRMKLKVEVYQDDEPTLEISGIPVCQNGSIRLYPKTARLSKTWEQANCINASQFSAFFAQRVRRLRRLTNHEIVRSTIHRLAG